MFTALITTLFPAGGWAVQLGKWLLSKLTLRNIAILIALLAIAYGQYRFYNWAQDRQYAEDKVIIDKVTGERDAAKNKFETYRTAFKQWVFTSETARLNLIKENKAYVAGVEARLKKSEQDRAELKRKLKDAIADAIPPAVDYDLPRGFVRVWSLSYQGESGTATAEETGVAYGLGEDAGRASGLRLSRFTAIGVDNNQECVARGQIIREWHAWYYHHKDLFEKAQAEADAAQPKVPADGSQGSK